MRGLYLARGDRRGIVAVDLQGEVYAVARWTGVPTKALRARFSDGQSLKTVTEVQAQIVAAIGAKLTGFIGEATRAFKQAADGVEAKRRAMVALHRAQRRALAGVQTFRAADEARERSQRFRKGLVGLWDRVSGRHARMRQQNEAEAELTQRRDADQRQALIDKQFVARRLLQAELCQTRHAHLREVAQLQRELATTLTREASETPRRPDITDDQSAPRQRRNLGLSPPGP